MPKKAIQAASDLIRFGARYATSSPFRIAVNGVVTEVAGLKEPTPQERSEAALAPASALPHRHLSYAALALSVITPRPQPRAVNLVLSEFDPERMFAGVSTALDVAAGLAADIDASVRVVILTERFSTEDSAAARDRLAERWGEAPEVVSRAEIHAHAFGDQDVWVVTHWTTAHPAQVACIANVLRPSQVVYLVQDYEPGFTGFSTESSVARSTYDAGFQLVVNSSPLAHFLVAAAGIDVPEERTFAPEIPVDRIQHLQPTPRAGSLRVLFYGRPSKPRNLFALGVAALDHAASRLEGELDVEFISAGELHDDVALGGDSTLRSVGTLGWSEYFELLSTVDVVLSLQASPHPSHPPLEAAMSGAFAVTNDFDGARSGLHDRLLAYEPDPSALGDGVVEALRRSRDTPRGGFAGLRAGALGRPLGDVLRLLAASLPEAGHASR